MNYLVYALIDNRKPNEYKYIGSTINYEQRLVNHLASRKRNRTELHKWINRTMPFVEMKILHICPTYEHMRQLEKSLIKFNRNELLNLMCYIKVYKQPKSKVIKSIVVIETQDTSEIKLLRSKHINKSDLKLGQLVSQNRTKNRSKTRHYVLKRDIKKR